MAKRLEWMLGNNECYSVPSPRCIPVVTYVKDILLRRTKNKQYDFNFQSLSKFTDKLVLLFWIPFSGNAVSGGKGESFSKQEACRRAGRRLLELTAY